MSKPVAAPGKMISVRGAREHNLKGIDIDLPRDRLIVLTGLSGSGKSSLAFDTIYAEGQRRYVESLSAYARQFLQMMQKPDVDQIDGLSPAISIEQKTTSRNPRSTVGTVTEIYDYMRLLFARVGVPYSPATGLPITSQTVSQMVDRVLALEEGTRLYLLAPIVRGRKGEYRKELAELMKRGFQRVKINGTFYDIAEAPALDKKFKHDIEVVVDRIVVRGDIATRLADSFQTALELADGIAIGEMADAPPSNDPSEARQGQSAAGRSGRPRGGGERSEPAASEKTPEARQGQTAAGRSGRPRGGGERSELAASEKSSEAKPGKAASDKTPERIVFSEKFACPVSGFTIPEIEPRLFSFNNPYGACPTCDGLGTERTIDADLVVPDHERTLRDNAITPWGKTSSPYYLQTLQALAKAYKFSLNKPWGKLPAKAREVILYGGGKDRITFAYDDGLRSYETKKTFEGVIPNLERRWRETDSAWIREEIERYHSSKPCDTCGGLRLKPEALAVKLDQLSISEVTDFSIRGAMAWFENLPATLSPQQKEIAERILKEICNRLRFLVDVGLDYLTLSRGSGSLSGGESQRIRLASQIGSGLTGVLYVLDEPSIGLHQRDNARLLETLKHLRDLGNTVIMVEHDEEAIREADHVVDIGPAAGIHGGEVVAEGKSADIMAAPRSLTGQYLSGALAIEVPQLRRPLQKKRVLKV
ncbi:MAG: excinuclease ABC subunit UvrA, partial [Alphaproteobacteria bacterium]